MKHHISSNANKQPYLRASFWAKTENHFWRSPLYSQQQQDELDERNMAWINSSRAHLQEIHNNQQSEAYARVRKS